MKNILIDTCSLIDLLSEDHNKLLPHLVFWQQNDCLNFVTHNIIIEEWNKHKEKQRNIFAQSLQIKYSHLHQIRKKEGLLIPERLEPDLHNIDSQIRIIDEILQNSVLLETTDDIKILCSDRTIIKKAPFHNKIDSTKDAYIIFSSLKYFNDKKEDLFFISANKKEFGSPDNLESKIHPEIIEGYTNINVQYESSIGKAINILRSELPISLSPEIINTNLSKTADIEIIIDKSKPILEQVYEYIIQRYKEIKYYPISLLVNHYPFKLNFSYYSLFNLNTDNEELVELFKSVEISQTNEVTINDENFYKGVDNYQNKIKTVLKHLSSNLIFNISLDKPRENIAIRYSTEKDCECPKCCYNKFKFSESFIGLSNYKDTQEELQQSSYINYRIGNYLLAIDKQQQALKKYQKKGLNTLTFISEFNLIKLSNFVRNNYFRENSQDELIDKLNNIDLEFLQTNLSTDENRKLLKYIKENSFYTDARNKIQELSGKLIDQYYSSLNGSWSSNSHVWSLINEFAQLESFIVGNYLIYDKFKEFQDISTIFIEGLFASYGIKDPQHSRLEDFDDWIIKQILIYGDAKIINKYFNRYKLKKIRYKRTSSDKDSFEELIENFFKNENLRESFIENCEEDNHRFWEYYNNIFKNIGYTNLAGS